MVMVQAMAHQAKCATLSQQEIVAQSRGTATSAEYYERKFHWTAGLISSAKAAPVATASLIKTADGAICKTHSMEQLMRAYNGARAAIAQLESVSRVKANFRSKAYSDFERASQVAVEATRDVLRSAKKAMKRDTEQREKAANLRS
ncbi:hypothetical protein EMPS_01670 [Entomortierella parvispora]|uniref:I/LWEQ domain-containing protein n=1 Tax=Entomortierella parvispora TaxID=205924 RepID=A0A9P3LSW3_9FUNG|nr:hypothetical protein EMPS_01670 [Entomortierella parvispora]